MSGGEVGLGRAIRRVDGALVAEPASDAEVSELMHVLADRKLALHRDVGFSRARLTRLGPIAAQSMTVEVGAGLRLLDVDARLRPHGLTIGPLTPAAMALTLGEFLEGAYAGLRATPGGRLEPLCTRLTAVLADGRLLVTSDAPRSAAGPDLAALVLGAHGRLGVVTSAVVRCTPFPEADVRACFSFPSAARCVDVLQRALAEGFLPLRVHADPGTGRVVVEIRWAGTTGAVERERELLGRLVDQAGGRAAGEGEREGPLSIEHESTWDAVREALEAGRRLQLFRLSLDTVVARGDVAGVPLDEARAWTSLGGRLLALDPRHLLGGMP